MNNHFNFDLEVLKAETREGRPFITIYATDTAPDSEGERCSDECLKGMVEQIRAGDVDLLNTHHDAIGFGDAVDAHIVDAGSINPEAAGHNALMVDVELDFDFPAARKLHAAAQDPVKRKKHGFSIGGNLNRDNPRCVTWERGKRVFNDLRLDHITTTRNNREANKRTHISGAVFKSLDMSEADIRQLQDAQAPYTVRDLAGKYGLPMDGEVTKEVTEAFFSGEAEEANGHTHRFTARLRGTSGTLIGSTTSPSSGDRHTHPIDLLGNEATVTAGASRGTDHRHPLGFASVAQITQDEFEKRVEAISESDPLTATKLLEGLAMTTKQTTTTQPQAQSTPTEAEIPAAAASPSQPVAEKVAIAPAIQAETEHESVGVLRSMSQALSSVFGRKIDPASLPQELEHIAGHITSDYSGDLDLLAKSCVGLLQRVSGIQYDRDGVSVRTAKLLEVLESAGMGKPMEHALDADALEAATAGVQSTAQEAGAAAADASESDVEVEQPHTSDEGIATQEGSDMNEEQYTKLKSDITAEVTEAILTPMQEAGLLPKKAVAAAEGTGDVAEHAEAAAEVNEEVDGAAEDATTDTEEAGDAAPEADVNGADAEPEADEGADNTVMEKVLSGLADVSSSIKALDQRIANVESAPEGRNSGGAHAVEPESKQKSVWDGAILG